MSVALLVDEQSLWRARKSLLDYVVNGLGFEPPSQPDFQAFEDGGMGSFFVLPEFGSNQPEKKVAEFQYYDADQMGVLVTAFSRDSRHISSFDLWRYDFEPLRAFPEPADLGPVRVLK